MLFVPPSMPFMVPEAEAVHDCLNTSTPPTECWPIVTASAYTNSTSPTGKSLQVSVTNILNSAETGWWTASISVVESVGITFESDPDNCYFTNTCDFQLSGYSDPGTGQRDMPIPEDWTVADVVVYTSRTGGNPFHLHLPEPTIITVALPATLPVITFTTGGAGECDGTWPDYYGKFYKEMQGSYLLPTFPS